MDYTDEDFDTDQDRFFGFYGRGSVYFGIVAINLVLTILTFGLYYPWAKARTRNYLWNETELLGSRFTFHGTGREMFKGFVIAYSFIILFYIFYFWLVSSDEPSLWLFLGFFFFMFVMFLLLIPFAIFSSWRYRVSRTSWRGIYFSFDGRFSEYYVLFLKYAGITLITFGLAAPWMRVAIQRYLMRHTQLGSMELDFHGEGSDLFLINLVGTILSYITIGLYIPFYTKNRYNFTVNHTTLNDGTIRRRMNSILTGSELFGVMFTNFMLLIVTLGLAFPFTKMRYLHILLSSTEVSPQLDFDGIEQTADFYNRATGDEMLDILDIDIDF